MPSFSGPPLAQNIEIERRLAAVLAADVAGYSRLTDQDEVGTMRMLSSQRAILDAAISKHRGRIANTAGDSVLAEFPSAVNAVQCAVEAQQALRDAAEGTAEDKRVLFRIGIHVGDVMVRGGDLLGGGVNVAARLEGLADPGGIVISAAAHEQVKKILPLAYTDLGAQQVKNIEEPIRAFAIGAVSAQLEAALTSRMPGDGKPLPLPDKPSIAVLPFQNMSGDPEQEYFADGMVEDIITALSRFKSLFVIARNSSFTYKGKAINITQVGRELDVRYVLEGSVRKVGGRIRITGQLIEASTGSHIWADKVDGALEDVFELQDQVTASVVGAIAPAVQLAEIKRAKRKPTDNLDSYDCFLKGLDFLNRGQPRDAVGWFREAVRKDPEYADALVMLVYSQQALEIRHGSLMSQEELSEAIRCVRYAARIAPDDAFVLARAAHSLCYLAREHDLASAMSDQALRLNVNLGTVWSTRGWIAIMCGDGERATECFTNFNRISPLDPQRHISWCGIAWACFLQDRYDEGCEWAIRSQQKGDTVIILSGLIVNAVRAGRQAEARDGVKRLMTFAPDFRVSHASRVFPLTPEPSAKIAEALKLAGVPE
jgi:adenylate cyclase